jgi:hypothetical protein
MNPFRSSSSVLVLLVSLAACGASVTRPPEVQQGSTLRGQVRQVATEVLIENVQVTAAGVTRVTTPNGRYQFDGLEVGEVTIVATYSGFERYERRVRILEGGNTHNIGMIPVDPIQPRADR